MFGQQATSCENLARLAQASEASGFRDGLGEHPGLLVVPAQDHLCDRACHVDNFKLQDLSTVSAHTSGKETLMQLASKPHCDRDRDRDHDRDRECETCLGTGGSVMVSAQSLAAASLATTRDPG